MFPRASGVMINGGTCINQTDLASGAMSRPSRIDVLTEWVAIEAFHNSDEPCYAPKCHPHTRIAVLDDIVRWVGESEPAREDFMMWLFGRAGAGKSAIARRIAEIEGLLIATFFFSRTLAYQLALSNSPGGLIRDPASILSLSHLFNSLKPFLLKNSLSLLASTNVTIAKSSRSEVDLVTAFNINLNEPLKSIHR